MEEFDKKRGSREMTELESWILAIVWLGLLYGISWLIIEIDYILRKNKEVKHVGGHKN